MLPRVPMGTVTARRRRMGAHHPAGASDGGTDHQGHRPAGAVAKQPGQQGHTEGANVDHSAAVAGHRSWRCPIAWRRRPGTHLGTRLRAAASARLPATRDLVKAAIVAAAELGVQTAGDVPPPTLG